MQTDRIKHIEDKTPPEPVFDKKSIAVKFPERIELKTEFESRYKLFSRIIDDFQNEYILPSYKYNANKTTLLEKTYLTQLTL